MKEAPLCTHELANCFHYCSQAISEGTIKMVNAEFSEGPFWAHLFQQKKKNAVQTKLLIL